MKTKLQSFQKIFLVLLLVLTSGLGWGQVWNYDFGTGTGTHPTNTVSTTFLTSSPSGGGTYRVRTGTGGGTILLANPGTSLGSGTELQVQSATSTSANKFGVYDWGTPSTVGYLKAKIRTTSSANGNLNISFGVNTIGNDSQGYSSHYNNSLASLTIAYTTGAISSVVRRISGSNTTISSSGLSKDSNQIIEIYGNNSSTSKTYVKNGTSYTLLTKTWDLWIDGTKIVTNGATAGTLAVSTNLSGFGFFAESSTSNVGYIYIDDIEYSNTLPTSVAPTVTTTTVSSIATTTASSGGNVTADGGASVTARGVYFGTSTSPSSGTSDGTGTGTYSSSLTALTPNTQYFYRAFATNSAGTGYGSESSFYTLAAVPTAPTVATPTSTTLNVTIGSGDTNSSATTYAIQETGGNYIQADGSLGASAVWQTASVWGTKTVTGLTSNTTYTFKVKARNNDTVPVETAFGSTASGTTTNPSYTSIASGNWSDSAIWSPTGVPSSGNDVIIETGHTVTMDVTTGGINTRNVGTNTTVNVGGTLATSQTYTNDGTTIINGSFQLNGGGWATGANNLVYGTAAGTLIFNATYTANNGTYWPATSGPVNVTVNSGCPLTLGFARTVSGTFATSAALSSTSNLTISGTCQINSASASFDTALTYSGTTTLIYNTNSNVNRGNEWNNSPTNVILQNNSALNYPNGLGYFTRTLTGNLTINSGSGLYMDWGSPGAGVGLLTVGGNLTNAGGLSLGNQVGGDIAVGGNWNNSGTFTPNGRAVTFNGTGTQTITNTLGETFAYLIHNKTAGTLQLENNVTVNGSSSNVLQLLDAGTFDLNGKSLTLSNNGGNIYVTGAARTISSSVANATFNITGTKTVTSASSGSLTIAPNVTTILTNGLNCGASLTTIQGTLQIDGGGYVSSNAPIYGNASTLNYNGVTGYGVGTEWTGNGTTAAAGIPQNVTLTTSSVNLPTSNRGLAGDITIGSGSTLTLNATSGDLYVAGNWSNSGTLTPNNKAVFFNGTVAQTLTGATIFDWLLLNNANGLTLNNNVTVNNTLTLTSGKITLGTNNLTINGISGEGTSTYVVTNSTGQLKRIVGASAIAFPVGNSTYNPITFNNSGTSDTYGVRVVDGALTTGATNTKTVSRSWVTTEAVAGNSNLSVVAQYNSGEENSGFLAATNPYLGFYDGATWTQQVATATGGNPYTYTSNTNFSPGDMTTGTQYFAIGKDNGFKKIATKLVITTITPTSPIVGTGFSVTVEAQDDYGAVANVVANTSFTLTTNGNAGAISGTVTGTILAGTSSIVVSGVQLATAGTLVTLTATQTAGDALTAATSSTFTVLGTASQLVFVGVPTSGSANTNLTSFTVQALRADNSLDTNYTGTVALSIATGPGALGGTYSVAAVGGVATFGAVQLTTGGVYTLTASSGSLTTATSGTINITGASDYFRTVGTGNWSATGTWEASNDGITWYSATLAPTNAATAITIKSGNTITVNSAATAKSVTVDNGGILTLTSSLTVNDGTGTDLVVNGTMNMNSGGSLVNNGTASFGATGVYNQSRSGNIPTAAWDAASTCIITGASSLPSNYAQSFGNFTWNGTSQSANFTVNNNAFQVNGLFRLLATSGFTFTMGGSAAGTYANTINSASIEGGIFAIAYSGGVTSTTTITNDLSISGTGEVRINGSAGIGTLNVGRDLLMSGSGYMDLLFASTCPSTTLTVTRDLTMSGNARIDYEVTNTASTSAVINVGRNFTSTSSGDTSSNVVIDFGGSTASGVVAGNALNIAGNFSYTGSGQIQTFSSNYPTGIVFNGAGTQTFTYTCPITLDWTPVTINSGSTLQLQNSFSIGEDTATPVTTFTVNGILDFQNYSISAVTSTVPRFNSAAGSTLITNNPNGLGGTGASGSLQGFNTVAATTLANGKAVFLAGTNYIFNADTTTPFPTTIGSAGTINVNANLTSNYTSTLGVTTALNVNGSSIFKLNPANNNNLTLSGVLTIASGATFDNNGTNQITLSGSPSIVVNGTFITRDPDGFVGTGAAIPTIVPTLNTGSTVEYGATADQAVQGGTAPTYQNITFSGSGIKTLVSTNPIAGNILIKDAAIFDQGSSSFGGATTNVTMTETASYKVGGSGLKPDATGTYTLGANTTIEFAGSSATKIRAGVSSPVIPYKNIVISGTNVALDYLATPINLQSAGTFTVKNGAIFRLSNTDGFSGGTTTAISSSNSPIITLESGSTVDYAGAAQTVTNAQSYKSLKISTAGIKTVVNDVTVEEDVTVSAGELLVPNAKNLYVTNQVLNTGGTITFENNASLIQVNDVNNSGNILYKRQTTINSPSDYVYWSAPVAGQTVPSGQNYFWNTLAGVTGNWIPVAGLTMLEGQGYIMKNIGTRNFSGVPFNGNVYVDVYRQSNFPNLDDNWNLIGNPYPSAISALEFISDTDNSNIEGEVAIWTHGSAISDANASPFYANFTYNYSPADYIYYNAMGDQSGHGFSGNIAAGQAFFVKVVDGATSLSSSVKFKNSMRTDAGGTAYGNSQFYRTANTTDEKHRIWLDIINSSSQSDRIMVGYATNATNDKDRLYDAARSTSTTGLRIYSLIGAEKMAIQGRALPFETNDIVPLAYNAPTAGNYSIAIHAVDGLFETQDVYLEDTQLNIVHNLKQAPYSFTVATVGENNTRFKIRYTTSTLGDEDFDSTDNVFIATKNALKVFSTAEQIESISVFDLLGRNIFTKTNINTSEFTIPIEKVNAPLIVKVKLTNGVVVDRKVLF